MSILLGEPIDPDDFYRISLETQKSNSGTFAEETILAGTLPANKLVSGRHIRVRAIFSGLNRASAGAGGSCTLNLYLGSTLIATLSVGDLDPTRGAILDAIIRFNGTDAQHGSMVITWGGASPRINAAVGTATETQSSALAVALKISGSAGAYTTNACSIELV